MRERSRFANTPWVRARLRALEIDPDDIAARVPSGYVLHAGGRGARGPWIIRLYRVGVTSEEIVRWDPVQDLGNGLEYALAIARGEITESEQRVMDGNR